MSDYLAPPKASFVNPDHVIPISPPPRPPFQHYLSSETLPATPRTPWAAASTSSPGSPRQLRPFLSLVPRLLLTTVSPCLLPLILTIAHLIQTRSSTATLASELKSVLSSACSGIATGAASLVSLPRYLAMQTNDEVVRTTQASILAIGAALIDCITIIEEVITFIVDTYRSVLLCTIELAVRGTLDILIYVVEVISDSVTSTCSTIRAEIQDAVSGGNAIIQDAVSAINTAIHLVDSSLTLSIANITVPELSALQNVTIPSSFEDTLLKLNASMPTLSELKSLMDELIDTPFEALKAEINATRLEIAASFNSSILPVPSLSLLSTSDASNFRNDLCGELDTGLIDDTAKALHKLGTVAIALMFLVLVLVWGTLAFWEYRRWRALQGTVEMVQTEWDRGAARDPWTVVAIVEHPILEKYVGPIINKVGRTNRMRSNLRWFLAYLSYPTMLTLLLIAAVGFIALEIQLAVLGGIKSSVAANANSTLTASTDSLVATLNAYSANHSAKYAIEFNAAVASYEDRINNELFGSWVNTTAVTLNTTLVQFYDEVEKLLNETFGSTILYSAINTFVYCLVGSKITNLETGLTWLSEHSKVSLPTAPRDILQLSNSSMQELAQPIVTAAAGSNSGTHDNGLVGTLIDRFESALRVERTVYAVLLALYLALFLIGLAVVCWHSGGREHYAAAHERYLALRGLPPRRGDTFVNVSKESHNWPWKKTPISDTYADDAKRPVPAIVEPEPVDSFFDYRRGSGATGLSRTLSALAAPGQAFLRMTGYHSDPDRATPLVQAGGSSEKYTRQPLSSPSPSPLRHADEQDSAFEPPPPPPPPLFWVHKIYGAVDSMRDYMRGRAHGATMLRRAGSVRTERSFGASQVPTARTPREWPVARTPSPVPAGRAVEINVTGALDARFPVGLAHPRRLVRQPTGDGAWADPAPPASNPFTREALPSRTDPFE
ncbi:plasma membrane fusion protein prm1 [Cryptotrichosporon argae]